MHHTRCYLKSCFLELSAWGGHMKFIPQYVVNHSEHTSVLFTKFPGMGLSEEEQSEF